MPQGYVSLVLHAHLPLIGRHSVHNALAAMAAGLGGGVVEVGPGDYVMRDSLHLRSHVRVTGTPGKTEELKPGDIVEVELEGVGTLRNEVVRGD